MDFADEVKASSPLNLSMNNLCSSFTQAIYIMIAKAFINFIFIYQSFKCYNDIYNMGNLD